MNLVTCGQNVDVLVLEGTTTEWHRKTPNLLDAWECAMHPVDKHGRPKHNNISENACLWLLEHGLGFCTRPGGIPIHHLAEAAAQKKTRLVKAMLSYFRSHLSIKKYQRAIAQAIHAAGRGWAGPREPQRPRFRQQRLNTTKTLDGHDEIIEVLLHASTDPAACLKQNADRKETEGLLSRAVRSAPSNAVYLFKKQTELGVVDLRDWRAAISHAIKLGDWEDVKKNRYEFFRLTFFPQSHPPYEPGKPGWGFPFAVLLL
ncbi:hypothetical protein PG997_014281 [Apiospora hydei]|uniref:Uncharacterized protein n=1 Tax=Apiospora hydei TaxID=1337664 RepID=A0ABR1UTC7_9PEZI